MAEKRLKFHGWGYEGEGFDETETKALFGRLAERYPAASFARKPPPKPEDMRLPKPKLAVPAKLARFASDAAFDRLTHTYGKSYPDAVRTFAGDFANAPDFVVFAESDRDVAETLDWATGANVAVIPFGGGSSVVGGVEPAVGGSFAGAVSLDLTRMDRIVEVDRTGRAARIQGGIRVPALEAGLKPHKLTLRHFPQSFEMATLGGMIATRSGGHFATLYTHIDEFVESLRCVTPAGVMESRRLPGSGAGPSPDRFLMGSEGALGIITEAWMRLQDRPVHRASVAVLFADIYRGAEAVRAVSQAGLYPANVRLLDGNEAAANGFGDGRRAVMVLAFESGDHPVGPWMDRALELCRDHGGSYDATAAKKPDGHLEGAAGTWRTAFIRMPYARELVVPNNVIDDTFETAITWDRFRTFHDRVKAATEQAIQEATGQPGLVTCRFTHSYPDGPAPYFTFLGLGTPGKLLEQWQHIKNKASDALMQEGGTITHHHAVGRDHMPWYRRQRPEPFGLALAAAKKALDPAGILNPGVIVANQRERN
ncbi:MAG: FAD-binding oxidoreductase [Alphaproteobacteria bacterium]|nr:FAD-binding oxidoreductase [Alphaproteobacteria bacterium]